MDIVILCVCANRRYCDLVVHRLLDAALKSKDPKHETELVGKIAKQCNDRKFKSKDAQDASQKLYLCIYLSNLQNQLQATSSIKPSTSPNVGIIVPALVYRVGNRSFDVIVDQYGLEKRVWVEDVISSGEVIACSQENEKNAITLYWKKTVMDYSVGNEDVCAGVDESDDILASSIQDISLDNDDCVTGNRFSQEATKGNSAHSILKGGKNIGVKKSYSEFPDDDGDSEWTSDDDNEKENIDKDNGELLIGKSPTSCPVLKAWSQPAPEANTNVPSAASLKQKVPMTPVSLPEEAKFKTPVRVMQQNALASPSSSKSTRGKRSDLDLDQVVKQRVSVFKKIFVRLVADTRKSPPDIKVYPVYPEEKISSSVNPSKYTAFSSCPGIDDERH